MLRMLSVFFCVVHLVPFKYDRSRLLDRGPVGLLASSTVGMLDGEALSMSFQRTTQTLNIED